jgi:hypothetical protein
MLRFFGYALACTLLCPATYWAAETPETKTAPETKAPEAKANEAPQPPVKEYELAYKFTAGEKLRTEVIHQATVQTTIQGTTQIAETRSLSIKVWQVKDVDDEGTVHFVHMVESIDMRQKSQGRKEIRYNSDEDSEAPPGYEDVAKAVGVPLTIVTMDKYGKIIKRQEKRLQPTSVSTQMTMPLPDHPVAIGATWSTPIDIDVTLKDGEVKKIKTRQKFTLDAVSDDVATIGVDSQILTPIHDPAIEAQLIQRLSSGNIRFDMTAGRVLSEQLDLDRHVVGFSGAGSSMHYVTRFTEKLLTSEVASKKKPRESTTK